MNYKTMLGMYRAAIYKCIDIICFDESSTTEDGIHKSLLDIEKAVDLMSVTAYGSKDMAETVVTDKDEERILARFHHILNQMRYIDQELSKQSTTSD